MAIHTYIIEKGEKPKTGDYSKQKSIDLQSNRAIYYHLSAMWKYIKERTDMEISDIEDAFFEEELLKTLFEIVSFEAKKTEQIPADSWIFNFETSHKKQLNGEDKILNSSDSIQVYLTEFFMKSSQYEVKSVVNKNITITVVKDWHEIHKTDLTYFLKEFLERIGDAIEMDKRLYFSYS